MNVSLIRLVTALAQDGHTDLIEQLEEIARRQDASLVGGMGARQIFGEFIREAEVPLEYAMEVISPKVGLLDADLA